MKKHCPICNTPSTEAFTPFCSKRCADIDLNRWFSGQYGIAAVELDDIEEGDFDLPPQEEQ